MAASAVRVERHGSGLWLWLNRPGALNALNSSIVAGLERGLDEAAVDDGVRAVVIAAEGRAFCAGADLKEVLGSSELVSRLGALFSRVEAFSKPVIAAVQGAALAGGLELVLCCDLWWRDVRRCSGTRMRTTGCSRRAGRRCGCRGGWGFRGPSS